MPIFAASAPRAWRSGPISLVAGRMFRSGTHELIAGVGARQFQGMGDRRQDRLCPMANGRSWALQGGELLDGRLVGDTER